MIALVIFASVTTGLYSQCPNPVSCSSNNGDIVSIKLGGQGGTKTTAIFSYANGLTFDAIGAVPNYIFKSTGTTRMTLLGGSGNLGLGCDPGAIMFKMYKADLPQFEIASQRSRLSLYIGPESFQTTSKLSPKRGDVIFRNLGESHNLIFWMPDNNNDGNSYIGFGDDLHNTWMWINNDATLRIEGTVIAKEMKCRTNIWSDYVFNDDYELKSLDEIELFINNNKHLPDVPNGSQIIEEGINIGEMNVILLRKVEELTLYLIKQDKQIKSLQKQLDQMNQ
jgi:hypothetical protein